MIATVEKLSANFGLCDHAEEQLQLKFASKLADKNFPALRKLNIEIDRGSVVVSGKLRSFHEKQVAISTVQGLDGVASVVDRIEVTG